MMTAEQFWPEWSKGKPNRLYGANRKSAIDFADAHAAAQLAEKERDVHFWKTEYEVCNELRLAAEQRLKEAQASYDREHAWLNLAATEANCDLSEVAGAVMVLKRCLRQREAELEQLREQKIIDADFGVQP